MNNYRNCIYICVSVLVFLFVLFVGPRKQAWAACNFPLSGNVTLQESCVINADSAEGADDAGGLETSTTNGATITVPTGKSITLASGVSGTTRLAAGSFILTGGALVVGSTNAALLPGKPLWVDDADGWPSGSTVYTATASGRRRRSLMHSIATTDCNDGSYSQNNACGPYYQQITITNGNDNPLNSLDALIQVDTASLIAEGKMNADCSDIRFYTLGGTPLTYWVEQGCNTDSTQIWGLVTTIPGAGSASIRMHYGNPALSSASETFSGSFVTMATGACTNGWSEDTTMTSTNRFPMGWTAYGTTGGANSHSHTYTANSTVSGGGAYPYPADGNYGGHYHGVSGTTGTDSNIPPYTNVLFCTQANDVDAKLPTTTLAVFDTLPASGWTRASGLDGTYPRGATTYGGTGGSSSFSHTVNGSSGGQSGGNGVGNTWAAEGPSAAVGHAHGYTSSVSGTQLPSYINVILATPNSLTAMSEGIIMGFTSVPPRGWTRVTAMDSRLLRGASTYGGVGGVSTHTHAVSATLAATGSVTGYWYGQGGGYETARLHTHTFSATTSISNKLPPYKTHLFYKKNSMSTFNVTISYGAEQSGPYP